MEYDRCYPNALIDSLAREVHKGCVNIKLTSYKDQQASDNDSNLPVLLNEAWTMLLANPLGYVEWEAGQVHMLENYVKKLQSEA